MIGKASADIIDTGLGGPKKQFIAGLLFSKWSHLFVLTLCTDKTVRSSCSIQGILRYRPNTESISENRLRDRLYIIWLTYASLTAYFHLLFIHV